MDCPSCGAPGQTKDRCEACGFTFPQDGGGDGDDALSLFLGLVCGSCDAYNDPGTLACMSCGTPLSPQIDDGGAQQPFSFGQLEEPAGTPVPSSSSTSTSSPPPSAMTAPPSWMTPPTGSPMSTQFAMKKVDLSSITEQGQGIGLAAPRPTPAPMAAPPSAPPIPGLGSGLGARTSSSPSSSPSSSSSSSASSSAAAAPKEKCWRCSTDLELNDKFCRNCGARTDGGVGGAPVSTSTAKPSSASTQMISALKLPSAAPPAGGAPGATMIIPAFKGGAPGLPGLGGPSGAGGAGGATGAGHAPAAPGGPSATMFFGAATAERVAKLILVRGQSQFGSQWRLQAGETVIGRSAGMVLFPDDTALAHKHAKLVFHGADLFLEPEPTINGAFLRLREPTRLFPGDEFVIGAQRLRLLKDDERPIGVAAASDHHGTRLLGSMVKQNPPLVVMRVAADPRFNEVYFRAQRLLTIGRIHCDVSFPNDGFVSERHAQLSNEGSHVLLEDLKSRNGTYSRVTQPTKLHHGDLLLLGDQVLRVELPQR